MTSASHHLSDCSKCENLEKSASIQKVLRYLSEIFTFRVKILMLSQQFEKLKKKKKNYLHKITSVVYPSLFEPSLSVC